MGLFAYKTSDTKKTFICQLYGEHLRNTCLTATLLLPNGEKFTGTYDGYGRIENKKGQSIDIFNAIMSENLQEALSNDDVMRDSFFKDFESNSKLIKLVENQKLKYDDVASSEDCESQGFIG